MHSDRLVINQYEQIWVSVMYTNIQTRPDNQQSASNVGHFGWLTRIMKTNATKYSTVMEEDS